MSGAGDDCGTVRERRDEDSHVNFFHKFSNDIPVGEGAQRYRGTTWRSEGWCRRSSGTPPGRSTPAGSCRALASTQPSRS